MRSIFRLVLGVAVAASLTASAAWGEVPYKTLTDAPRNLNGARSHVNVPVEWEMNRWVEAWVPNDTYVPNLAGAMGADLEFFSFERAARVGIWAGKDIQEKSPKSIVGQMAERMQELTGGDWTTARNINVAGVPATQVTGVDVFGNYHYDLYALERFGQKYAVAIRTPYENRWDRDLNIDIAYLISHLHPTTLWVQHEMGHK
ncbi:MAG: hypothetical protein HY319_05155 [Armatimonadetes bacterium]|nr:hypothetical protein [Armatimonadota bacterium]